MWQKKLVGCRLWGKQFFVWLAMETVFFLTARIQGRSPFDLWSCDFTSQDAASCDINVVWHLCHMTLQCWVTPWLWGVKYSKPSLTRSHKNQKKIRDKQSFAISKVLEFSLHWSCNVRMENFQQSCQLTPTRGRRGGLNKMTATKLLTSNTRKMRQQDQKAKTRNNWSA